MRNHPLGYSTRESSEEHEGLAALARGEANHISQRTALHRTGASVYVPEEDGHGVDHYPPLGTGGKASKGCGPR